MHFPFSQSSRAHAMLTALVAAVPFTLAASVAERSLDARAAPTCSTANPHPNNYTYVGCAHDGAKRALTGYYQHASGDNYMSYQSCFLTCSSKGFNIMGVETGRECYCGNSFENGEGYAIPESSCNSYIMNNSVGGPWALAIYEASVSEVSYSSDDCVLPAGWKPFEYTYANTCVQDGPNRALTGYSFTSDKMSYDLCTSTCASKNFKLAGIEMGDECYCGNELENGEGNAISADNCNVVTPVGMAPGVKGDWGGGRWALTLYTSITMGKSVAPVPRPPAPKKRSLKERHYGRNLPGSSL
ncbi:G- protein-coupled receptor [Steccherinum ochraceum]|uniref:G-protein-coupled receptor n=1 Tax=Steccherinum ochraceum TaxID=92696 RepID=A0A4R0RFX8_9APHY|nr:G- protein-coupled receptor [Steccherinum ochraceum]